MGVIVKPWAMGWSSQVPSAISSDKQKDKEISLRAGEPTWLRLIAKCQNCLTYIKKKHLIKRKYKKAISDGFPLDNMLIF